MNAAMKKKYCHLLMFDIASEHGHGQETGLTNNESVQNDDLKPSTNDDYKKESTFETPASSKNKKRKPRARRPRRAPRPPRPPNAFILYRKAKQPGVVAQDKSLTNAQVSKVISKMWWKETEQERLHWERRADLMKLKH